MLSKFYRHGRNLRDDKIDELRILPLMSNAFRNNIATLIEIKW